MILLTPFFKLGLAVPPPPPLVVVVLADYITPGQVILLLLFPIARAVVSFFV